MRVVAIIPAAGRGERMGQGDSKAFLALAGQPLLFYTLNRVHDCEILDELVLVVPGDKLPVSRGLVAEGGFSKVKKVVAGGESRQESVAKGLAEVDPSADIVVIHDGARPLVDSRLIEEAIKAAREFGAVAAAVPVKDTVRTISVEGRLLDRLERDRVALVQTPQAFNYDWFKQAHERAKEDGFLATDDAALVERLGRPVHMILGAYSNIKVTTPEDLLLAEALLKRD